MHMIDVLLFEYTSTNKYHITANDATIYKMIGEPPENGQQLFSTVITDDYPVTKLVFGPHLI